MKSRKSLLTTSTPRFRATAITVLSVPRSTPTTLIFAVIVDRVAGRWLICEQGNTGWEFRSMCLPTLGLRNVGDKRYDGKGGCCVPHWPGCIEKSKVHETSGCSFTRRRNRPLQVASWQGNAIKFKKAHRLSAVSFTFRYLQLEIRKLLYQGTDVTMSSFI